MDAIMERQSISYMKAELDLSAQHSHSLGLDSGRLPYDNIAILLVVFSDRFVLEHLPVWLLAWEDH